VNPFATGGTKNKYFDKFASSLPGGGQPLNTPNYTQKPGQTGLAKLKV